MKKRKCFLLGTFLLVAMFTPNIYCLEKTDSYIIKNVEYYPMLDGYCAMTALRMNLKYYGVDVDPSLLLNLGWNYGFIYIKTPFYTVAYPDTDPVEEIVYASRLLGFKAEVLTHESLEGAKKSLVKYISMNKPVIVQWIPHTVLAYGYRENGSKIVYHDPGNPTNDVMASFISSYQTGRGREVQMDITEWVKMPFLWNMRQFQMVVVEPSDKKININWKNIWKRNAEKVLGIVKNPYPAYYGITGVKEIIKDLKKLSSQNNKQLLEFLSWFNMTFELGVGFRRNAASFLAGQASLLKNSALHRASITFRESAHLFREGLILIKWVNEHPEHAEKVRESLIDIFERIVNSEQKGAGFLLEASK